MKRNTENIVNIVKIALENLESETIKDIEPGLDKNYFFEEFRKLIIQLPRRSGNTTAAIKLVNLYPNSVILEPNIQIVNSIKYIDYNIEVIPHRKITKEWTMGREILDLIIIDTSVMFKQAELDKLYNLLKYSTKLIVVLG